MNDFKTQAEPLTAEAIKNHAEQQERERAFVSKFETSKTFTINCKTQGHLWGPNGQCVMCKEPKPSALVEELRTQQYIHGCAVEVNIVSEALKKQSDLFRRAADEIQRLESDVQLARIETAHFSNVQHGTQAELERYKHALYEANGRLMKLDQEPVKLGYAAKNSV
jgi:hypothetical protein